MYLCRKLAIGVKQHKLVVVVVGWFDCKESEKKTFIFYGMK